MYRQINVTKNEDLALWCTFLVAFYFLFRKSNVVPKETNFDVSKILTRDNIAIAIDTVVSQKLISTKRMICIFQFQQIITLVLICSGKLSCWKRLLAPPMTPQPSPTTRTGTSPSSYSPAAWRPSWGKLAWTLTYSAVIHFAVVVLRFSSPWVRLSSWSRYWADGLLWYTLAISSWTSKTG